MAQIFLLMFFGLTSASAVDTSQVPEDGIALIQIHQPYITRDFVTSDYSWQTIEKNFPQAKLVGKYATYKRDLNETVWHLNEKKQVIRVTFTFDLSKWIGTAAERKLLERYKDKITPDAFSNVPNDTRQMTVKDSRGIFEFDVFFPVSNLENHMIRSVTIYKRGRGK
jgi:hypothetical protein